jgi:hypothetical protein
MMQHSTGIQECGPEKLGLSCKPNEIIRLAFAFWQAKAVLSAVELGVFDKLSEQAADAEDLARQINIHPRGAQDFFDALVSLGLLTKLGDRYQNAPAADQYLTRSRPQTYVGSLLEFATQRLYPVWDKLTEALRTGQPQNEAKQESNYYGNLTQDVKRLKVFLEGMTGLSMESAQRIAHEFEWQNFRTFADIGGAQGALAVQLATAHGHLNGISYDLPAVASFFCDYVEQFHLNGRLKFQSGDFFREPLPSADVLIMGHVLHNWNLEQKQLLLQKAYDALPRPGALLIYDSMIDECREVNTFGLLMSLNMLLVTAGGSGYTADECVDWMERARFHSVQVKTLGTFDSLVIGYK